MSGVPGSTTMRNFVPVSVCTVQVSNVRCPTMPLSCAFAGHVLKHMQCTVVSSEACNTLAHSN